MVKLVKVDAPAERQLGTAAGLVQYTPGWDTPLTDEELEAFLGG